MKWILIFEILFLFGGHSVFSQNKFNLLNTESDKIKFDLIDNLIILPVSVNGVELSFLLDTGVSRPILFNILNFADSLQLKNLKTISLRGFGADGAVSSIKSDNNVVKIGKALNLNQELYVVFDNSINFTPVLGVPVHGIIGYDFLKDFVVEINYSKQYIKLHNPATYKYKTCRKCETIPLEFNVKKPYLKASMVKDGKNIPLNLLIDTGGSDDLWLFEDTSLGIEPIENRFFEDYLGRGLSGSVYGKRSRVAQFNLSRFSFKEVNAAFPDSSSIELAKHVKDRNGSVSGGILRRFNLILNYPQAKLTLKKNSDFKLPFSYNKSGIVLEQRGFRVVKEVMQPVVKDIYGQRNDGGITLTTSVTYGYNLKPSFEIVEVRPNSVAEKAGVKVGDVVLSINGKETQNLSLQAVNRMFFLKVGSTIKLRVERNKKQLTFEFKLEDVFK